MFFNWPLTPYLRSIAFVAAAAIGFAALAWLDAWRPTSSWFERLSVWLIGFSLARALGMFAGAPLRAQKKAVTKRGLGAALLFALGLQVLTWSLLWELVAPAMGDAPSWRLDLILSGLTLATLPLFLLGVRLERPGALAPR